MKIKPEHYQHMRTAIAAVNVQEIRLAILNSASQPRDFNVRLMWDCLRAAGLMPWVCDTLYPYLSDDNITAALRKVGKELGFTV